MSETTQDSTTATHRQISVKLGVLTRADGSCQWSQGKTSVLVAVYGPHPPKRREHILPDRAYVHFKVLADQPHRSQGRAVVIKSFLQQAFKSGGLQILDSLYPRSQISIIVQVLFDDGSLLAACINAISLALVDAGIQTADHLTSAATACIFRASGTVAPELAHTQTATQTVTPSSNKGEAYTIVLDPTSAVLSSPNCDAESTFAWDQNNRLILAHWTWRNAPHTRTIHNPGSDDMNVDDDTDGTAVLSEAERSQRAQASHELFWATKDLCKDSCKYLLVFKRQVLTRKIIHDAKVTAEASGLQGSAAKVHKETKQSSSK